MVLNHFLLTKLRLKGKHWFVYETNGCLWCSLRW